MDYTGAIVLYCCLRFNPVAAPKAPNANRPKIVVGSGTEATGESTGVGVGSAAKVPPSKNTAESKAVSDVSAIANLIVLVLPGTNPVA